MYIICCLNSLISHCGDKLKAKYNNTSKDANIFQFKELLMISPGWKDSETNLETFKKVEKTTGK